MKRNYIRNLKLKRQKRIDEIIEYIIANNGPDEEGRGHPIKKRLKYNDLDAALTIAQYKGFCKDVKPYHFYNTDNIYENSWIIDEIIIKKIDQLLANKYHGHLVELIINTTQKELILEPLIDYLDGRPIKVIVLGAACNLSDKGCSIFEIIRRYIELKRLGKKFEGLRPYHFNKTTPGTYDNPEFVDDVVVKKIDQLLSEKYHGDLVNLIKNTTAYELAAPLIDYLDGRPIKVSMSRASCKASDRQYSPYDLVSRYIKIKGLKKKFKDLKPYHFTVASQGTFSNPHVVDELLVKKLDQLLEKRYDGDLFKLIKNTHARELLSPLIDYVDGKPVKVGMSMVGHKTGNKDCSPFEMVWHYIKLKGWGKKQGLKSLINIHLRLRGVRSRSGRVTDIGFGVKLENLTIK